MNSLCYAANHDFLASLRELKSEEVTPQAEQAAATAAQVWWKSYLTNHPDGDWIDAAIVGFKEAGYKIERPLDSPASKAELLRALESKDEIKRYNAYRLLNHLYGAHFDLQRVLPTIMR